MADDQVMKANLTYGELLQVCLNVHTFMQRDQDEFLLYGIDNIKIGEFFSAIDEFKMMPSDADLEAYCKNATYTKNLAASDLKALLKTFDMRAKMAFGADNPLYGLFHAYNLSHMPDADLLFFAMDVIIESGKHAQELTPYGYTPQLHAELTAKRTSLEVLMIEQETAIANRDLAARNRRAAANVIYDLLVTYTELGKLIWYNVNEAYYNDYIIYNNISPGGLDAPTGLAFSTATKVFIWNAVTNATSYQLQMSVDVGVNWTEVYAGAAPTVTFTPPSGNLQFRCRARNENGYGPFGTVLSFPYYPDLEPPQNLVIIVDYDPELVMQLQWDPVPGATSYNVYMCETEIGGPSGTFVSKGSVPDCKMQFMHPAVPMRYYFRVKAANSLDISSYSVTVNKDVYAVPS